MDSKASQGDADGVEGEENGSHDANRMKVKMDLAEVRSQSLVDETMQEL
jgi:hypothetical protein